MPFDLNLQIKLYNRLTILLIKYHYIFQIIQMYDYVCVNNSLLIFYFQVFWLKNGETVDVQQERNFIISNDGGLIINQAHLFDSGNYTCGAQNIAGRRVGEPAVLTVYSKYRSNIVTHTFCHLVDILCDWLSLSWC